MSGVATGTVSSLTRTPIAPSSPFSMLMIRTLSVSMTSRAAAGAPYAYSISAPVHD
ncbi:Uncharacterised protein [Bordetella pertussis]|nr:Uncharacterised protein [Bordetella pertussis]